MQLPLAVPVGTRRPGPRPTDRPADHGAVSVEAAFGVLALLAVVSALVWFLSLFIAQLAVGEAARAAARVAARGDDLAAVRDEAHRLVADAVVVVRTESGHVVVEVSRTVTAPGVLARWGAVDLHADATALVEEAP